MSGFPYPALAALNSGESSPHEPGISPCSLANTCIRSCVCQSAEKSATLWLMWSCMVRYAITPTPRIDANRIRMMAFRNLLAQVLPTGSIADAAGTLEATSLNQPFIVRQRPLRGRRRRARRATAAMLCCLPRPICNQLTYFSIALPLDEASRK